MAKVAVFFFALFVFLLATGVVAAQPLGLRPGMTLAEVRSIAPAARPVPNNPHLYDATSVKGGDDNPSRPRDGIGRPLVVPIVPQLRRTLRTPTAGTRVSTW